MTIGEIAAIAAALISVLSLLLSRRDKRFDEIKDAIKDLTREMNCRFDKVDSRLQDLGERVAFLEGETLHTSAMIPDNPRSAAAKEVWKRRRTRKLARKE